jgi:predicted RNA-binding protein YlqC (UPF0109 family)
MGEEGSDTITDSSQADEESRPTADELDAVKDQGEALKELLEFLAANLVTKPEAVEVTHSISDDSSVLELRVDKGDLGRVIGKQGRTAKSLRTILNAAASRTNCRAVLEIIED